MVNHRSALVAAVREDLATARGTARAVLAAAESARHEAQQRRRLVRQAYTTCLAQLAEARDTARLDILRRFHASAASLSYDIEALAATCAAGAAGASWPAWSIDTDDDGDAAAHGGLLRIGTLAYEPPAAPGRATDRRPALPALVPLLDEAHLELTGDPDRVDDVVTGLLLRLLGSTRPGDVRLAVHDPRSGGALAGFAPLVKAGLVTIVDHDGLPALLDDLVRHVRRVDETVLAGEYTSLAELAAATGGSRPVPWQVGVLLAGPDDAGALTAAGRAQLDLLARTGVPCGVHLLARGLPLGPYPHVHRVVVAAGRTVCDSMGELPIHLDPTPPADRVAALSRSIAGRLPAGPPPGRLRDLMPARLWEQSSAAGLSTPIGAGPGGEPVDVPLGDGAPHALVGGPPGTGTTNLIHAWLASLTARYGPEELALYLLDFGSAAPHEVSSSASFARVTPRPRDPSWLPQVRLAAVNVAADREFGLAVLRHLGEELRARAQAAKRHEAIDLAELRAEDPDGHWPRIVAVVDEFTVLLAGADAVAEEATHLLDDLARRGRAQGIHLVLATRHASGIDALSAHPGLIGQFPLRIALPRARGVLAGGNLAADVIPRGHAVVNTASGAAGANQVVRVPDAGDRAAWRTTQHRQWRSRPEGCAPPRLFDGHAVPRLAAAHRPAGRLPADGADPGSSPGAVLGERIDVRAGPARLRLGRMPGRNLAVLGTRTGDACDVLAAAALSLAAQGPARFSIVCLDPRALTAATRLAAELPRCVHYAAEDVAELLAALCAELDTPSAVPHYLVGYALDAGRFAQCPGPGGHEHLRRLLCRGPERRSHLLGWWRSAAALRADLSAGDPAAGAGAAAHGVARNGTAAHGAAADGTASDGAAGKGAAGPDRAAAGCVDAIGAWVALDVQGADLGPLSPQPGGPAWHPRPHRALFFDRSVHRSPEVIIPYEVNSDHT